MNYFLLLPKDGQLDAYLLQYGFHHWAAILSRGFQEKPRFTRRHSSSWQKQPKRIGAATAASAGWLRVPAEAGRILTSRRGAGVQPGSFACDGAPVFETGLVQDAAPKADHPRGGLRQPHHHQPLLLRTVQLLLHPQAHPQGGGCLPVLLVLQAEAFHHHDVYFELSGPAATHQEEAHPARQTVPLYIHRPGLKARRNVLCVCVCVCVFHTRILRCQDCPYQKKRGCHAAKNTCLSPPGRTHPWGRPTRGLLLLHDVWINVDMQLINQSWTALTTVTPHRSENKHHCTGTPTWEWARFTHGFLSPAEDCATPVYLVTKKHFPRFCISVCIRVCPTGLFPLCGIRWIRMGYL